MTVNLCRGKKKWVIPEWCTFMHGFLTIFLTCFNKHVFFSVSARLPACWHVDAPLLPCRCLCCQKLLLRTRLKYGHSCYMVKGFALSEANGELCTVSHFHCLSLSSCQDQLWQKKQNSESWGKPRNLVKMLKVGRAQPRRGENLQPISCCKVMCLNVFFPLKQILFPFT